MRTHHSQILEQERKEKVDIGVIPEMCWYLEAKNGHVP